MNIENLRQKIKNTSLKDKLWGSFGIVAIASFSYAAFETLKIYNSTMEYVNSVTNFNGIKYGENIISDLSTGYGTHNELYVTNGDIKITFIDGIDETSAMSEDFYQSRIEEIIITDSDTTRRMVFDGCSPTNIKDAENMMEFYGANEFYNNTRRAFVRQKFQEQFPKRKNNDYNLVKN